MTISPEMLQLLIKELGPNHPTIQPLVKERRNEFSAKIQAKLGIHPDLIALRQASRDYELGEGSLKARIRALRTCEDQEIDPDLVLHNIELGRRDAKMARVIRANTK